jgi:PHD/YefM family antitoxin component YafN of YafNO toxin-antitoxin module
VTGFPEFPNRQETLINRSNNMGVVIERENYESINIITEMEKARQLLQEKAKIVPLENNNEEYDHLLSENESEGSVGNELGMNETMKGDTSDSDGIQWVIQTRRRAKPNRLSLSGKKEGRKVKNQITRDTLVCWREERIVRETLASQNPLQENRKKGKRLNNERPDLEL